MSYGGTNAGSSSMLAKVMHKGSRCGKEVSFLLEEIVYEVFAVLVEEICFYRWHVLEEFVIHNLSCCDNSLQIQMERALRNQGATSH